MDFKIEEVERHDDERGKLVILLKKNNLAKELRQFGEIFYITFAKKGVVRANHYHKNWQEWFMVVSGKLQVILEDVKTKKRFVTVLGGRKDKIVKLKVGPLVAHAFKALTKNTCLLNYSTHVWKKDDVFPYQLIPKTKNVSKKN